MDHYLDLHLLPDPDFNPAQLMSALYTKLHRALVALGSTQIAVSFPQMQAEASGLGQVMRLHGQRTDLQGLMASNWLNTMRSHLRMLDIAPVPAHATYRTLRRVQFKTNAERLRRRFIKRHACTPAEAQQRIPDRPQYSHRLPYVALASQSTGQHFRLFLQAGPPQNQPQPGHFNTYGLSSQATIPWF